MGTKFLTVEGRTRLEEELINLKTVQRPEIVRRIHEAKEFGELSEGGEPEEVKNEQAFIEGRIMMLERLLKEAQVISEHRADVVSIGATVTVRRQGHAQRDYTIVGTEEIDLASGKISNESPLGRALVGKRVGANAVAQTPGGPQAYEIVSIR